MNAIRQPFLQPAELTAAHVALERLPAEVSPRLLHELGGEEISERVSREIADPAEAPVDVLQTTVPVVRRRQVEQLLETLVPRPRQLRRRKVAADQRLLQLEAQDDVQVVGRLISFDADERRLHVVDREHEIVERDAAERREDLEHLREEVLPERPAAADLVFPEPRLRFVNAERARGAERFAEMLWRQVLLVDAVPAFVE